MGTTVSQTLTSTTGTVIPDVRVESAPAAWSNRIWIGVLGLCIGTGGIANASSLPSSQISRDVSIKICEEGRENSRVTELSSVPEQLAAIQRYMSLNVSQLASTFGVSRQTVHQWLKAQREPYPRRQGKIGLVFEIAREWRSVSSKPLGGSLHKRLGEASVLDELARDPIDEHAVRAKLTELHRALASSESRQSIADVALAKGGKTLKRASSWKDDEIL